MSIVHKDTISRKGWMQGQWSLTLRHGGGRGWGGVIRPAQGTTRDDDDDGNLAIVGLCEGLIMIFPR